MNATAAGSLPWDWIAEKYLGMDVIKLQQELEQEIQANIMSKTMPKMKLWQKKTSKGKKESETPTAKSLKKTLDDAIGEFCKLYSLDKISPGGFKKTILSQQDQTILSQFLIVLYKNGKTVKVKKLSTLAQQLSTKIEIPLDELTLKEEELISPVWKTKANKNPMNPFSKKSKQAIMEGKLAEVVKFHLARNHNALWENCLACKAIRAFVQWEFHQPISNAPKKQNKILTSGKSASLIDKAAHAKQIKIEVDLIKEAAQSNVIMDATVKSLTEDDNLLFESEAFDLNDPDTDDPFGDTHGTK